MTDPRVLPDTLVVSLIVVHFLCLSSVCVLYRCCTSCWLSWSSTCFSSCWHEITDPECNGGMTSLVQVSVQRCHSHLDSGTQSQHESLTHGYRDRAYHGGVGCCCLIEAAPTWSHAGEALSFSMLAWLMTSETLVTLSAADVDAHSRARHDAQCLSALVYTSDAVIRSG